MDINSTKFLPREAGASKVPAAARFLSSPVCLPSRTAEGRGQRRGGLSMRVAFWEVESLESFFIIIILETAKYGYYPLFSLLSRALAYVAIHTMAKDSVYGGILTVRGELHVFILPEYTETVRQSIRMI